MKFICDFPSRIKDILLFIPINNISHGLIALLKTVFLRIMGKVPDVFVTTLASVTVTVLLLSLFNFLGSYVKTKCS